VKSFDPGNSIGNSVRDSVGNSVYDSVGESP
jgi:hypothetical protein